MESKEEREKVIREYLISHWKEEDRKYRVVWDTTNSCPEICMLLNELYSDEPLSDFHLETYKALEE